MAQIINHDEVISRRFGSKHVKPCKRPPILECAMWECQIADKCQLHNETREQLIDRIDDKDARIADLEAELASCIRAVESWHEKAVEFDARLSALTAQRDAVVEALNDLLSICRMGGERTPARDVYDRARSVIATIEKGAQHPPVPYEPQITTRSKCGAKAIAFVCDRRGCPVNGGAAYG